MEVISIERSTYEELLTSFNSFVGEEDSHRSRGQEEISVYELKAQCL